MTERFVAPENDTRALVGLDAGTDVHVTVVIPIHNRVSLLDRVLAGLSVQDHPSALLSVVVADDGSTEDVNAVVEGWTDRLAISCVRREHDGYGAGQARNLGAASADGEVLLFLDADCLPAPDLVRRHAAWHTRATNIVVVGARHDLDTTDIDPEAIASRAWSPADHGGAPPSDWRGLFYRRSSQLRAGDEGYRAVISNNLSVRRALFLEVGGFCEDFVRWGGEDTELGWRLWRAGAYVVAENAAVVFHQVQEDSDPGWREAQRARNDGLVTTKIPQRFYRRSQPGVRYEVPKLSYVVHPVVPARADALLDDLRRQSLEDWEVVLHDPDGDLESFADLHRADPRVCVVTGDDPLAAFAAARGDLVAVLHGAASLDHRAGARVVRRLDTRPRTSLVTVGARDEHDGAVVLATHAADLRPLAAAWCSVLPPLVVLRGRAVATVLPSVGTVEELWDALQPLVTPAHLREVLVALPDRATAPSGVGDHRPFRSPRSRLAEDLSDGNVRTAARTAAAIATGRAAQPARVTTRADAPPATPAAAHGDEVTSTTVQARYVGWVGRDNLGDEAMLDAAKLLMPWAEVTTKGDPGDLLILGGGTLINRRVYLDWLRDKDSPRSERVVLGTGVGSPDFWGQSESPADWAEFLGTCGYVGVRGPASERHLRAFGYDGPLEVCGDLAFALERPADVATVEGRLIVSPVHTGGELHGGDDLHVIDSLADLVASSVAEGREVELLACHPADDRWCFEIMRRAGHPELPYIAGYDDTPAALRALAAADVVVAERLHAAILAATVGTSFVAVEYRPKVADFASSVDADELVVRTDALSGDVLRERLTHLTNHRTELDERVAAAVGTYRGRLHGAAATIEGLLR